jgi:hypothetical protein
VYPIWAVELSERLADLAADLRADLVDPVAPEPQDLARRAEREGELDGLLQAVPELDRDVAAAQGNRPEAGDLQLLADGIGVGTVSIRRSA